MTYKIVCGSTDQSSIEDTEKKINELETDGFNAVNIALSQSNNSKIACILMHKKKYS